MSLNVRSASCLPASSMRSSSGGAGNGGWQEDVLLLIETWFRTCRWDRRRRRNQVEASLSKDWNSAGYITPHIPQAREPQPGVHTAALWKEPSRWEGGEGEWSSPFTQGMEGKRLSPLYPLTQ